MVQQDKKDILHNPGRPWKCWSINKCRLCKKLGQTVSTIQVEQRSVDCVQTDCPLSWQNKVVSSTTIKDYNILQICQGCMILPNCVQGSAWTMRWELTRHLQHRPSKLQELKRFPCSVSIIYYTFLHIFRTILIPGPLSLAVDDYADTVLAKSQTTRTNK